MTEWKLFDGDVPYVSTFEFHEHRERAPHLEQEAHQGRLFRAAGMIRESGGPLETFSDLGCGDGGLLSLVQDAFYRAWGYDFAPANIPGWTQRGVTAEALDVFNIPPEARDWKVAVGSVAAMTEVLEHLADPHGVVKWLHDMGEVRDLVCSSPHDENAGSHDECHAWAWDMSGYASMITEAGWRISAHEQVGRFQVVKATR